MNLLKYILLATLITSLFAGCIEPIELEIRTEDGAPLILVEGQVTTDPGPQELTLRLTPSYGSQETRPITDAVVWITDDLGNEEFYVNVGANTGRYMLFQNTVKGEIGRAYQVHFRLADGRTYISQPDTLHANATVDSVFVEISFTTRVLESGQTRVDHFFDAYMNVDLENLQTTDYLRWEVERWYQFTEIECPGQPFWYPKSCYIQTFPNRQKVQLFNGENVEKSRWDNQLMFSLLLDWSFYERNYIIINQYSLSQPAYQYWQDVGRVANQTGGIFDPPPAAVRGNIRNVEDDSELVLGFFAATQKQIYRKWFVRQNYGLNNMIPFCNENYYYYLFQNPGHPCLGCTKLLNSTAQRPDFW